MVGPLSGSHIGKGGPAGPTPPAVIIHVDLPLQLVREGKAVGAQRIDAQAGDGADGNIHRGMGVALILNQVRKPEKRDIAEITDGIFHDGLVVGIEAHRGGLDVPSGFLAVVGGVMAAVDLVIADLGSADGLPLHHHLAVEKTEFFREDCFGTEIVGQQIPAINLPELIKADVSLGGCLLGGRVKMNLVGQ